IGFHKPGFVGRWDATWYEINALGMRGPEWESNRTPDEFRVLCVGDSCTFGKGVLEKDSWPRQLEALLQGRFEGTPTARRALVGNLGLNGGDGRTYESLYRSIGDALEPHLVVIGYNLNDFPNSIQAIDQKVFRQASLRTMIPEGLRDSMNRSALYRTLRATYYHMRRDRDWKVAENMAAQSATQPIDSPVWMQQRRHLEAIRDLAAARGGKTLVLLFPYESQLYLESFDKTAIRRMEEICADLDLPFIDLASCFVDAVKETGASYFLRGDRYHPNAEGYSVVAQSVMEELERQGWLEFPATQGSDG
ncbi:MAG: SGNH/GDSL hydrolase family protein, partial [Planctomycetes bacterium]|nr:SGNH/GDSL hydrolase family protein [Planctomycetota bacterium]